MSALGGGAPPPAGMLLRTRGVHATDGFVLLPPAACAALMAARPPLPLVLQLSADPPPPPGEPRSWHVPAMRLRACVPALRSFLRI
jgi:hypothetical protein